MEYRYEPKGVCSYEMIIDIDGDTIKKVTVEVQETQLEFQD